MRPSGTHSGSIDLPDSLRRLWSWWLGEVTAALQPFWIRLAGPVLPGLIVSLESDVAVITKSKAGEWVEVGRVVLAGARLPDDGKIERDSGPSPARKAAPVTLRLSAQSSLRRCVSYPQAARGDLKSILSHQMDDLTPYSAEQVYFDYRVIDQGSRTGVLAVELTAAPRAIVDKQIEQVAALGFSVDAVTLGDGADNALGPINLLNGRSNGRTRGPKRRLIVGLALANLILLSLSIGLPPLREAMEIRALRAEIQTLGLEMENVIRLREQLDQLDAESQILQAKRSARPLSILVIRELTRAIPDATWLEQLSLRDGRLGIEGFSPRASALISKIERVPLFREVNFGAPVVKDRSSGLERFRISSSLTLEADR